MIRGNLIDHTNLSPTAQTHDIDILCREAIQYGFYSVCVNGSYTALAKKNLQHTDVVVCTVVGFPLGQSTSEMKAVEAEKAVADGATEIDMVMNIAKLKERDTLFVEKDIRAVRDAIGSKALLKVIIESGLLTKEEIVLACQIAVKAGADFVKTSTGFLGTGATLEAVKLMKKTVGDTIKVKASGGIRDKKTAEAMIQAGAQRIGASASVHIVEES